LRLNQKKIRNPKLHINKLQQHFNGKSQFTTQDIELFYRGLEPDVKCNTVNWRVYALVQSGILARSGKGKFALGTNRTFIPELSAKIKNLYRDIQRQFPYIRICVWSTSVFNEFMLHQPGRHYLLVEVDKDVTQSVFHFLTEKKKSIFLEPTAEVLSLYASKEKNAVIIKSLVSEAPVQQLQNVFTVTLEKMLVDIFCDDVLFSAQQGSEMQTIFRNAFDKYTINENKMLRYADRRRKKEAFLNYLHKIPNFRQLSSDAANQ
jgi:hypothetical protein